MSWLDVAFFGVIVLVGFGFARMGYKLNSRMLVKLPKNGKDAKEGKEGADKGQDAQLPKIDRLISGLFYAGFGMFIIWTAISTYLPLALNNAEKQPNSIEIPASELMGEVILKVMVLKSTSQAEDQKSLEEEKAPAAGEVGVRDQEPPLGNDTLGRVADQWQWEEVVRYKPLPRPELFVSHP